MKRARPTKNPTVTQLENICSNLREAYPKGYVNVSLEVMGYTTNYQETRYTLNMEGRSFLRFLKWSELWDKYFGLMKEAKNG